MATEHSFTKALVGQSPVSIRMSSQVLNRYSLTSYIQVA